MFEFLKKKPWPKDAISRKAEGARYSDSWTDQPRTGKVTDADIAAYVIKHTHWWDRLDVHFVSDCVLEATYILWGYIEPPKGKWFFGKNYYGRWIEDDEWEKTHNEFPRKEFIKSVEKTGKDSATSVRYR